MNRKLLAIVPILLLLPAAAHADAADEINAIVTRFHDVSHTWLGPLQAHAANTFLILATLQFAVSFVTGWTRSGQLPDLSGVLAWLIRNILVTGFFYWLLTEFPQLCQWIIGSFTQASAEATGSNVMSPGDVFAAGVTLFVRILKELSILHPADSVVIALFALAVILLFGFICAEMVVTLCQVYFISGCGVLLLAFGGCEFLSDIAISVLRAVFAIGAKVFGLQLVVGMGLALMRITVQKFNAGFDFSEVGIIIGEAMVLAAVTKIIPTWLERICGGFSVGSGAGMAFAAGASFAGGAAAAGGKAVGAAASATGAAAAVTSGASAARASVAAQVQQGMGPRSAAGQMARLVGGTVGNVASGVARDLGSSISRQAAGRMGFRVADDIAKRSAKP